MELGNKPLVKLIAGGAFGAFAAVLMSVILLLNGGDYDAAIALFVTSILPVLVSFVAGYRKKDPLLTQVFERLAAYEEAAKLYSPNTQITIEKKE